MTRTPLTSLAILLLLAATAVGCTGADGAETTSATPAKNESGDKAAETNEKEKKKEEAVPVEVTEIELGPIEAVLSFSANLEAEGQVMVVSQAKRLITELRVEEGDRVRRGQVLLRLQDDEQKSALSKVKSQLAKAEREYQQQERLYEQELISEQVFHDATYELDQLHISLADAERELSYTEVRASISGTITSRLINLGDQVQIGQELFEIIDFDSIVARVYVPEKNLAELRTGLPARVAAEAAGESTFNCTIKRIAPVVDPKSGTIKVTVAVGSQPGLRPGMYVDVDLVTATRAAAVLVPKRALVYDNEQVFVYRLGDEKRVERVFVEARLTDKFHIEPMEGIQAGDRLVVAGQAGLKDGALVSVPGDSGEASTDVEETDHTVERASL